MSALLRISPTWITLLLLCLLPLQTTTQGWPSFWAQIIGQQTVDEVREAFKGERLTTDLDSGLRDVFVNERRVSMQRAARAKVFEQNRAKGKSQAVIPPTEPFPCDLSNARSIVPPTSVHELRPGDIDVIACMGDSLSAGNGLMSGRVQHSFNENRALSFCGGGYGDWRSYLTLPNILRVFNPNITGYATKNELVMDRSSRLNIAEPLIMSIDMPYQARVIIDRMRHDPNIDMENHWKLLTIFVGNNDVCIDMCHYDNATEFVHRHELDLRHTLTVLRDNIPRLLINLLPVPNMVVTLYPMQNVPFGCFAVHSFGCHCIFSHAVGKKELKEAYDRIAMWHKVDQYVSELPEFQTNDFAVVYQPFTADMVTPRLENGETDYRFFAHDCFHFSQLGHAGMANSLWNSMLQPVGKKLLNMVPPFRHFECPTEERPYFATLYNTWEKE